MSLLITDAYAGTIGQGANDGGLSMVMMLAGFGIIFYFLIWRPQNQRMREQRELIASIKKGDEVVTTGGILGLVTATTDQFVTIQIAESIEIKVQKSSISATLPKGTLKSI